MNFKNWKIFFRSAGIKPPLDRTYAEKFVEHKIPIERLCDVTKEYLQEMGISIIGHIILILRHCKTVHEELKKEKKREEYDEKNLKISQSNLCAAAERVAKYESKSIVKPVTTQKRKIVPISEVRTKMLVKERKSLRELDERTDEDHMADTEIMKYNIISKNKKIQYLKKQIRQLEEERDSALELNARLITLNHRIKKMNRWISKVIIGEAAEFGNYFGLDVSEFEDSILDSSIFKRNQNYHCFEYLPPKKKQKPSSQRLRLRRNVVLPSVESLNDLISYPIFNEENSNKISRFV